MAHGKLTSVTIFRSDSEYLEDLQYHIRKKLNRDLNKYIVLKKVLEFVKAKEKEFFDWLEKNL